MVKETINNYAELWKELMEDTPDSQKVRGSLILFDNSIKTTDIFWKTHEYFFSDSHLAMFDYGIYCVAVKNLED
jgi:hypothetical protein